MTSSQSGQMTGAKNDDKKRALVLRALDQYEQRLVRYVARLLSGDSERARDVVQHAFMKLCQQDVLEIEKRIRPWLYSVCRNKVFDDSKRKTTEQVSDESEIACADSDPSVIADQHEFVGLIRQLVLKLPDAQREAIDLWADGFSSREIGEVMNKQEPAVRALVHRAINNIRSNPQVVRWTGDIESQPEPLSKQVR